MHLTPLDILLFGLVVFAAWRMFRGRGQDRRPPGRPRPIPGPGRREAPGSGDPAEPADEPTDEEEVRRRQASEAYRRAQASWDSLRNAPRPGDGPATDPQASRPKAAGAATSGRNEEADFLEGAKAMFARIRESWGDRDLDDLAQFLTPHCLDEFKARAASEPPAGRTDVMLVEAELLDMGPEQARVRYSALVREAEKGDAPSQVREDWTFLRPAGDPSATWRLDRIAETAA